MINPDLEQWLHSSGYEHYVFISYPNAEGAAAVRCANAIARAVRRRFADFTTRSDCHRVFVDKECIAKGGEWEPTLRTALCKSVLMVAVCAPIYYEQTHKWCGLEYQAMLSLGQIRGISAVLPMVVRRFKDYPLPEAVKQLQYIDVTVESTKDPGYFNRPKFDKVLDDIVDRLVNVATTMRDNNVKANAEHFNFPDRSAFEDYNGRRQSAPLRRPK
jgi:hypothetical protein